MDVSKAAPLVIIELSGNVLFILTAPQPPSLGVGRSLVINILPSDDAFGVFGFTADSLVRLVSETSGGAIVNLTVARSAGTFGEVMTLWQVEGATNDITPSNGVIVFAEGQTQQTITLIVPDDMVSRPIDKGT